MPGSDPSDPDGLENGRDSADQQCRKDGPRYVTLGLFGNASHNDHGQDHRRNDYHSRLKTSANGY